MYTVKTDNNFEQVIRYCAGTKRNYQKGTWITEDMIGAYCALHRAGFAHSFETYHGADLVGGLYGISLGRAFFGESMFYLMRDASKVALHSLVDWAAAHEFLLIDAQQSTSHMKSMGAREIPRDEFLQLLKKALEFNTLRGKWRISDE